MKKYILLLALVCVYYISPQKTIPVVIDNHLLILEIAQTTEQLQRGLMYRKYLPSNHGMLFDFSTPGNYAIWMKNTLLALDLIWLDSHKRIVYFLDNVPICRQVPCKVYAPPYNVPTRFVIEINSGLRKKLHLQIGMSVDFITQA